MIQKLATEHLSFSLQSRISVFPVIHLGEFGNKRFQCYIKFKNYQMYNENIQPHPVGQE